MGEAIDPASAGEANEPGWQKKQREILQRIAAHDADGPNPSPARQDQTSEVLFSVETSGRLRDLQEAAEQDERLRQKAARDALKEGATPEPQSDDKLSPRARQEIEAAQARRHEEERWHALGQQIRSAAISAEQSRAREWPGSINTTAEARKKADELAERMRSDKDVPGEPS